MKYREVVVVVQCIYEAISSKKRKKLQRAIEIVRCHQMQLKVLNIEFHLSWQM